MSSPRDPEELPDGGALAGEVQDLLPKSLHGFKVTLGMGPYPPDQPMSPRRAIYAELEPEHPAVKKLMRQQGKARILGMVPVTPQAATELRLDPWGRLAEVLSRRALGEAVKHAKLVADAAGVKRDKSGLVLPSSSG